MAYDLSDGEPAHFYSLLSDPLRTEYSNLLLSLFTLKLVIDGGITNDIDGCRGYYIALAGDKICERVFMALGENV
jgi:hypothetical protein